MTLVCTFPDPLLHDYNVKMPNFAFYEERKQATTKFNSLSELGYEPQGNNFRGFAYICQSKWVGIIAIKTERTQIHFLSDVLVAVASLDLKVPLTMTRWYRDDFKMSFIWRINDSASINQVRWRQCN